MFSRYPPLAPRFSRSALAAPLVLLGLAATACGGPAGGSGSPVRLPGVPATTASPVTTGLGSDPAARLAPPVASGAAVAAVDVVQRYYQALNDLPDRMDARALAATMTSDCPCRVQVNAVRDAAAHGEHYVDHVALVAVTPAVSSPDAVDVLVEFDAGRGGLVDAGGHPVSSAPAQSGVKRMFRVRHSHGRWLIARIETA